MKSNQLTVEFRKKMLYSLVGFFFLPGCVFCQNLEVDGDVIVNGRISGVTDPDSANDAATKAYVDHLVQDAVQQAHSRGSYGIVEDIDGNVYKTVRIGNQVWMADNLKATRYNDGNSIHYVEDDLNWLGLSTPAYCWYENDSMKYSKLYGALYNHYVVTDTNSHNVCPVGWHVPTLSEWTVLSDFLIDQGYGLGSGGSAIGKSMASTFQWTRDSSSLTVVGYDAGSNNSSGFVGLPAGYRNNNSGTFHAERAVSHWWTATNAGGTTGFDFYIIFSSSDLISNTYDKRFGFSVRCLQN